MEFKDLKFVRLKIEPNENINNSMATILFRRIPRELFKQIKGSDLNIDSLLQFAPFLLINPLVFIYILLNEKDVIKGILWVDVNPVEQIMYVEMLSIDKEYQNNGDSLGGTLDFIRSIPEYKNLKQKIVMTTRHVKAFEKAGWKQTEKVRMEI